MTPDALLPRMLRRSRGLPLLEPEYYRTSNPDLAAEDPLGHFARHGVWEDRSLGDSRRQQAAIAALCRTLAPPHPLPLAAGALALRRAARLRVRVLRPAAASRRSRECADLAEAALEAAGVDLVALGASAPTLEIRVDPSERCEEATAPSFIARLARTFVMLSDVPIGSSAHSRLPQALLSAGVIALAPETFAVFAATGAPSLWLASPAPGPPRRSPSGWEAVLPDGPVPPSWEERPYDFAAFGTLNSRRSDAWFPMTTSLSARRGFVHMPRPRDGRDPDADIALRRYVFARSRLALHLQEGAPRAPDWLTVCGAAVAQGALLVSEPGLAHPVLTPGVHFFEAPPRRIPALVEWLLNTPEGRLEAEARRLAARAALRRTDDLLDTGVRLVAFLTAHAGARP